MALELVDPSKITPSTQHPRIGDICGVYYLGYGRNAWHSTWINVYNKSCISFSFTELRNSAEHYRTRGSVLKIQSLPLIPIVQGGDLFGVAPINDRYSGRYKKLQQHIEDASPEEFWTGFPNASDKWLLMFQIRTWDVLVSPYTAKRWQAHSAGSDFMLSWQGVEATEQYPEFRKFARWLVNYYRRNWIFKP